MRKLCVCFTLIVIVCFSSSFVGAQNNKLIPYNWDAANLSLGYPSGWAQPTASEKDGRLKLQLAQSAAENRPPADPLITLSLIPNDKTPIDEKQALQQSFQETGMIPGDLAFTTLLGLDGSAATAASADKKMFGLGRAVKLPDNRLLVVIGQVGADQKTVFTPLFNMVANSIAQGTLALSNQQNYGVAWITTRNVASGPDAFVNLSDITYAANGKLYAVDTNLGVIELDAKTGRVLKMTASDQIKLPSGIAVDGQNVVYVGDSVCQCVLVLDSDGSWRDPIGNFDSQSPASITAAPDGTLYATDQTDTGIILRVIKGKDERKIAFGEDVIAQPLLAVDKGGNLLALTVEGAVMKLNGDQWQTAATLDLRALQVNAFTLDASNNFVLAIDGQGITIMKTSGEPLAAVGRLVANTPQPGEMVKPHGVAVSPDGTIFVSDSDNTFGAVTAFSTTVLPGRIGATMLISGLPVLGTLDASTGQQDWTFTAAAGQRVTIAAVDATQTGALTLAIQLIAPSGKAETTNNNQQTTDLLLPSDAEIPNYTFKSSGVYTIRVQLVNGSGPYVLALTQEQPFELDKDGKAVLSGLLGSAIPLQRWSFDGRAGDTYTITVVPADGTLDPSVRLLDARDKVIADNDDAADQTLGRGAQIVAFKLPASGRYTIEARRFDGEGSYTLTIAPPSAAGS